MMKRALMMLMATVAMKMMMAVIWKELDFEVPLFGFCLACHLCLRVRLKRRLVAMFLPL